MLQRLCTSCNATSHHRASACMENQARRRQRPFASSMYLRCAVLVQASSSARLLLMLMEIAAFLAICGTVPPWREHLRELCSATDDHCMTAGPRHVQSSSIKLGYRIRVGFGHATYECCAAAWKAAHRRCAIPANGDACSDDGLESWRGIVKVGSASVKSVSCHSCD